MTLIQGCIRMAMSWLAQNLASIASCITKHEPTLREIVTHANAVFNSYKKLRRILSERIHTIQRGLALKDNIPCKVHVRACTEVVELAHKEKFVRQR